MKKNVGKKKQIEISVMYSVYLYYPFPVSINVYKKFQIKRPWPTPLSWWPPLDAGHSRCWPFPYPYMLWVSEHLSVRLPFRCLLVWQCVMCHRPRSLGRFSMSAGKKRVLPLCGTRSHSLSVLDHRRLLHIVARTLRDAIRTIHTIHAVDALLGRALQIQL